MIKVIDNFLTKSYHKELLSILDNADFPWHYNRNISDNEKDDASPYSFGFSHIFFDAFKGGQRDTWYASFVKPMLYQIMDTVGANWIIRARADMTVATPNNFEHGAHVDFSFSNISTVFYVNESDGDTIFFDKEPIVEVVNGEKIVQPFDKNELNVVDRVSPKANRLVIFPGNIAHTGCSPKNYKNRILINSNYEMEGDNA